MLTYLTKRILLALATLFLIVFASYCLLRLAPGDPTRSSIFGAETNVSQSSDGGAFSRNQSMAEELGLHVGVLPGFAAWLGNLASGHGFGRSIVVEPGRPVMQVLIPRMWVTLRLNVIAVALTWLLAIPIGVWAAVHVDSWAERGVTVLSFFLYSLPGMWLALLLQSALCQGGLLPWFPLQGLQVGNADSLSSWRLAGETVLHYILPVLCLSYAGVAMLTRYVRGGMLESLHQDFIRTARAKGLPDRTVIWRHAFRNALITLITLSAGMLPGLVVGSVIVEYVFGISGMGALALLSLSSRDYPLQMAIFVITGALTLGGILLADLLYSWADPRISLNK